VQKEIAYKETSLCLMSSVLPQVILSQTLTKSFTSFIFHFVSYKF